MVKDTAWTRYMVNVARTLDTHTSSRHSLRTLKGTHDPTTLFGHHPPPDSPLLPDALYIYSDVEFGTKLYLLWVGLSSSCEEFFSENCLNRNCHFLLYQSFFSLLTIFMSQFCCLFGGTPVTCCRHTARCFD